MEEGWVPKKLGDGGVKLAANEDIVTQLVSMGFNYLHCQKAAISTSNAGVEAAMNWLLTHMNDPDIDDPITKEAKSAPHYSDIDPLKVDTLVSFGFEEELARKALLASDGDIEKATEWIFNPPSGTSHVDISPSNSAAEVDAFLPDGDGKYWLIGLVSHIGTSTHCGHYVAHIRKDGRWVIFNDEKVGASTNPPIDMGYLYFFERIDS